MLWWGAGIGQLNSVSKILRGDVETDSDVYTNEIGKYGKLRIFITATGGSNSIQKSGASYLNSCTLQ